MLPLILLKMSFPLLLGYFVTAERFLIDTVVFNRFYIGKDFKLPSVNLLDDLGVKAVFLDNEKFMIQSN